MQLRKHTHTLGTRTHTYTHPIPVCRYVYGSHAFQKPQSARCSTKEVLKASSLHSEISSAKIIMDQY